MIRRPPRSTHCISSAASDVYKRQDINKMNRYNNILPYKHTSVKLSVENTEVDENLKRIQMYINANWINTPFKQSKKYIATQGPLQSSFNNFWKMIWQESVDTIIMLCKLKENNQVQCDQYWPKSKDQKEVYDQVIIETIADEEIGSQIQKRIFKLTKPNCKETKYVSQYQWLGWPDHGVPLDNQFQVVNRIITIIINTIEDNRIPVIHCSAGVGRTGTLIAIANLTMTFLHYKNDIIELLTKSVDQNDKKWKNIRISIFSTVRRLREQRWGMVYTCLLYTSPSPRDQA
eukprot:TRINITY_DN32056_c0_g1_i2.p1 TRINITY_DN32056_c0_g1~~TRINITY_DN32056_c0_g1_i2.p1  ORF type:complete len:289 (-),score=52.26 TRINITY_DN32056_c0_g1_i2:74-940(-)